MALRTFYLNKRDAKFWGVCSGISDYTGVDVTLVRIGAVVVTLLGAFPWTILAYGLAALLVKSGPHGAHENRGLRSGVTARSSARDLRMSMRDIDRRMAEVETYVTSTESSLAREIEQLRQPRVEPANPA
ncbi:PspC domain-containing protein [Sphingosinicella rhizophila]|uniref:PspC domain-containing protein n=1 Tax=Sphingosinicella rhizophila TaxID=3050082 RepID=A0ABU3Q6A0_9SPHN|nr:PspC domain-containing protein [Sphingosinicella sp. GR2756]MDT9598934.1 PspC domain-containing protein [Sphingosinicella sp. GR2756]